MAEDLQSRPADEDRSKDDRVGLAKPKTRIKRGIPDTEYRIQNKWLMATRETPLTFLRCRRSRLAGKLRVLFGATPHLSEFSRSTNGINAQQPKFPRLPLARNLIVLHAFPLKRTKRE
jgi:hypothetical protein